MNKNEMRAIRREWINYYIHWNHFHSADKLSLSEIKNAIRQLEVTKFNYELRAYA